MTDFTHSRVSLDLAAAGRRWASMADYLAVFLASGHEGPPESAGFRRRSSRCHWLAVLTHSKLHPSVTRGFLAGGRLGAQPLSLMCKAARRKLITKAGIAAS